MAQTLDIGFSPAGRIKWRLRSGGSSDFTEGIFVPHPLIIPTASWPAPESGNNPVDNPIQGFIPKLSHLGNKKAFVGCEKLGGSGKAGDPQTTLTKIAVLKWQRTSVRIRVAGDLT